MIAIKADNENEIRAVHGVRFMSALGLIMSHKAMALFYNPYVNRTDMIEVSFFLTCSQTLSYSALDVSPLNL